MYPAHRSIPGTLALLLSGCAVGLLLFQSYVNAGPPGGSSAPKRGYYLTPNTFNGNQALTACANGYHFASFAELHNTSDLYYDIALGRTVADSGGGPPTNTAGVGWIRSGFTSNSNRANGPTNCNVWTSNSANDEGSIYFLDPVNNGMDLIYVAPTACDNSAGVNAGVWCIEN